MTYKIQQHFSCFFLFNFYFFKSTMFLLILFLLLIRWFRHVIRSLLFSLSCFHFFSCERSSSRSANLWWVSECVSVITQVEIHLSNLIHSVYTCTVNWFNKHMYSKLVLYILLQDISKWLACSVCPIVMSVPCTFFLLEMSVPCTFLELLYNQFTVQLYTKSVCSKVSQNQFTVHVYTKPV